MLHVLCPPEEQCFHLALEAETWTTRHVAAVLPGTEPTIQTLHAHDYTLHTASSEASYSIDHLSALPALLELIEHG